MLMITVKSGLAKDRVAFWERHPAHPDGEIFITDDQEHQAGDTAGVRAAIQEGRLVVVVESGGAGERGSRGEKIIQAKQVAPVKPKGRK
jgi:hypothetical protein